MNWWPSKKSDVPDHLSVYLNDLKEHESELGLQSGDRIAVYAIGNDATVYATWLTAALLEGFDVIYGATLRIGKERVRNFNTSTYEGRRCVFVDDNYDGEHRDAIQRRLKKISVQQGNGKPKITGAVYLSAQPKVRIESYELRSQTDVEVTVPLEHLERSLREIPHD